MVLRHFVLAMTAFIAGDVLFSVCMAFCKVGNHQQSIFQGNVRTSSDAISQNISPRSPLNRDQIRQDIKSPHLV
jgi:hypothetical protein